MSVRELVMLTLIEVPWLC